MKTIKILATLAASVVLSLGMANSAHAGTRGGPPQPAPCLRYCVPTPDQGHLPPCKPGRHLCPIIHGTPVVAAPAAPAYVGIPVILLPIPDPGTYLPPCTVVVGKRCPI